MKTLRPTRRLSAIAAATLTIGLIGLTSACGTSEEETPTTTTTTTTTTVSPTEKAIDPTGGNKFTPSVKAPTPATAVPGDN